MLHLKTQYRETHVFVGFTGAVLKVFYPFNM